MHALFVDLLGMLVLAMLVAILARRLSLPYTVGLVAAGCAVAALDVPIEVALTRNEIFLVLLPPLLFEGALNLDWRELRGDLLPVLTLTVFGVIISAAVVAFGMIRLANWPPQTAVIFGVLIGATDPVAVIAMFRDSGLRGRLAVFVEAESLFNDGIAAVLFGLALTWSQAGHITWLDGAEAILRSAGGGLAIGLACAGVAVALAGRTTDHLVETALTVVGAFGAFHLAEDLGASGVMATVAAGLVVGNVHYAGWRAWLSSLGKPFLLDFWSFAAFLANSVVFILIGISSAHLHSAGHLVEALLLAIVLVLAGRALAVYSLAFPFRRSRWAIPLREQHVLWWGGLRGALALALALSLPDSVPGRDDVIATTCGVVIFSIAVQGISMPALLRALGLLAARS